MSHAPRIVSLLPSATEIICALGLADLLVAVTHECDYPSVVLAKPQITRSRLTPDMSSGEIDDAVREQFDQRRAFALHHRPPDAGQPEA